MLKVVFNEDGSINELIVMESINQGSNNVNKVFASILGRSIEDYTCVGEFELPGGDLEELSGVVDSQEVGVNTYSGYTISLAESVTRQAGNLKLNLKLIDLQDNVLCTYQVTLKVNKTGYEPNITHITEAQYNALLQSLNSKYVAGNVLLFLESYSDLPSIGLVNTIYCIPNEDYETNHLYDEYTWIPSTSSYRFFGRFLNALDSFYPIGAIYISSVSTSPASLFGGTWEQINNGNPVRISLGSTAPVVTGADHAGQGTAVKFKYVDGQNVDNNRFLGFYNNAAKAYPVGSYDLSATGAIEPINLVADLSNSIQLYMWKRIA